MTNESARSPLMLAALSLAARDCRLFLRQPSRVAGAFATPVLIWVMIGSGLGRSFSSAMFTDPVSYLEYFYPGVLVMVLLFTSIFNMISVIEDRHSGFLQAALVAPISRAAIPLGKILASTLLGTLQATILLLLAPLAHVPLDAWRLLGVLPIIALVAAGLSGLGFVAAWRMDSSQGFHAIMNLVLLPMWVLSGAVFPASGAAGWLQVVLAINPVSYGLGAIRTMLYGSHALAAGHLPSLWVCLAVTTAFMLGSLWLSITAVRK